MNAEEAYTCINCASAVKGLYKKYSPTVLKLTTCSHCNLLADKYIEYDPIIIVIDLILLNREAYRHVLFNTTYAFHWKLLVILELMEAFWEVSIQHKSQKSSSELQSFDKNETPVLLDKFYTGDLEFYKTCLKVILRNFFFISIIFFLTLLNNSLYNKRKVLGHLAIGVLKCVTLSSFGMFLFLPSLIWDKLGVEEYHFVFVILYMSLSQLIAYTVFCNCSKVWSIFVITIAYLVKISTFDFLNIQL